MRIRMRTRMMMGMEMGMGMRTWMGWPTCDLAPFYRKRLR